MNSSRPRIPDTTSSGVLSLYFRLSSRLALVMAVISAFACGGCKPPAERKFEAWDKKYQKLAERRKQASSASVEMLRAALQDAEADSRLYEVAVVEAWRRDLNPAAHAGLRELLERKPGDVKLQSLRGMILREEGFLAESESHLDHQLSLSPKDPDLFAALLKTQLASYSLEKAYELLRDTELHRKTSSYYDVAALIHMARGETQDAFDSLFLSLAQVNYKLGSPRFRDLARLSRLLDRPLLDRHFYSLFRPQAFPADVQNLYAEQHVDESCAIQSAVLKVSVSESMVVTYEHRIQVSILRDISEILVPVLLPAGDVSQSVVKMNPPLEHGLVQTNDGKTRIHHVIFRDSVPAMTQLTVDISYEDLRKEFDLNHPWIWRDVPLIYPWSLELGADEDFGVDAASMIRENKEKGLQIVTTRTSAGVEVRPGSQRVFFMPAVSFAQAPGLLFLANKMAGLACSFAVVALVAALAVHYKASRGVVVAMIVFSAAWGVTVVFSFLPDSIVPDVPDLLLGRVLSPAQNFPQSVLALVLGGAIIALACFSSWLTGTHSGVYAEPGGFWLLAPVVLPLSITAIGCLLTVRLITTNMGWQLASYFFAGAGLVSVGCALWVNRIGGFSAIRTGGMVFAGAMLAIVLPDHAGFRVGVNAIFVLCGGLFLVHMWLHYRHVRDKLPDSLESSESLLESLQLSISTTLDRYKVLLRVCALVSGSVVFLLVLLRMSELMTSRSG